MSDNSKSSNFEKTMKEIAKGLPPHETMDPLVTFLYLLMRDQLPAGVVMELLASSHKSGEGMSILSNGYLGKFAEHIAAKLRRVGEEEEGETPKEPVTVSGFRKRKLEKKETSL